MPEPEHAGQVVTATSLARVVYPFVFDPGTFDVRRSAASTPSPALVEHAPQVWQPAPFSHDDLLQQVHDFLNDAADTYATAMRWRMTNDAMQSRQILWANTAKWRLVSEGVSGGASIPFAFDEVHLSLFSSGVGFLSFTAHPITPIQSADASFDEWSDFIHFFRFARGQRDVSLEAQRRTGKDTWEGFVPAVAQRSYEQRGDGKLLLMDIISGLLSLLSLPGEEGSWWDEVFVPGQLMPYTVLFTRGIPEPDMPLAVYRARNFFNSRQDLRPLPQDLDLDRNSRVLPYVEGAWFTFSLDGGAFITGDGLPQNGFFTGTLPEHLANLYYVIFLLALHQRFALMRFSNEIAKAWMGDPCEETLPRQTEALDVLRREFTLFTTRGYFAQITQQEHHHAVYRRWQETFQIPRLYDDVRNAIEQLSQHVEEAQQRHANQLQEVANRQEHLRQQLERRHDRFISFATAILAGPAFMIALLQTTHDDATVAQALWWSLAGLIFSVTVVWLYDVWARRKVDT